MKRCNYCNVYHPLSDEFWRIQTRNDREVPRVVYTCKEKEKHRRQKMKYKLYQKEYREGRKTSDPEKYREYVRRYSEKRRSTDSYKKYQLEYRRRTGPRLSRNLRSRLYAAIKGDLKTSSAVSDLGCTIEEFKLYIENQFQPGMTWENYGEWHIDHLLPLSSFDLTKKSELLEACHYLNLQPLWKIDNLQKSCQLP